MSVVITMKFPGDVAKFRQALNEHGDQFAKMAQDARASGGGIHHRFAVGDDFVLVVDEWQSAGHFQEFFANPDLQALCDSDRRIVVVTAHRRENWGDGLRGIAEGVARVADRHPEIGVVLPVHPNPRVLGDALDVFDR